MQGYIRKQIRRDYFRNRGFTMNAVVERIGVSMFIQVIIGCWNELFILFLLLTLLLGIRRDRKISNELDIEIPMSHEIIVYTFTVLMFNLCDIILALLTGIDTPAAEFCMQCCAFGYYASAEFHSLFIMWLFRKNVVDVVNRLFPRCTSYAVHFLHLPMMLLILTAPLTGFLYQIRAHTVFSRTLGYSLWQSITMFTMLYVGAELIVYWKYIDRNFCQTLACAVFMPLAGMIVSYISGLRLTNSLAFLAVIIIYLLHIRHKALLAIRNIYELTRTKTLLAESRFALEHSKNQTLMAQIQPHFINNCLMALASRCANDPEIYESIMNFSLYLRSHFEAISNAGVISFEQEMANIEAYLALASESAGERLQVEYEIDYDDFLVPALSVQPLVENAVQHGIHMYEEGGTVTIAARREQDRIVVEVRDEGHGASSITPQQKKRRGIGIENVRARLRSMSDGELEIIQGENGTTARITLTECGEANSYDDTIRGRSAADYGTDAQDADEH